MNNLREIQQAHFSLMKRIGTSGMAPHKLIGGKPTAGLHGAGIFDLIEDLKSSVAAFSKM